MEPLPSGQEAKAKGAARFDEAQASRRNACFLDVARYMGNVEVCSLLLSQYRRLYCESERGMAYCSRSHAVIKDAQQRGTSKRRTKPH